MKFKLLIALSTLFISGISHASINDFNLKTLFRCNVYSSDIADESGNIPRSFSNRTIVTSNLDLGDSFVSPNDVVGVRILKRNLFFQYFKGGKFLEVEIIRLDQFGKPVEIIDSYNNASLIVEFSNRYSDVPERIESTDGRFVFAKSTSRTPGGGNQGEGGRRPPRTSMFNSVTYNADDGRLFFNFDCK